MLANAESGGSNEDANPPVGFGRGDRAVSAALDSPESGANPSSESAARDPKASFLQGVWDQNARQDAYFSVLGGDSLPGKHWQSREFYATGRDEIEGVLRRFARDGLPVRFDRTLDFGCGPGRLTEALADHSARVTGVDISREMIARARAQSTHPNASYLVNPNSDLRLFPNGSFDLCVSHLVLQHVGHELAVRYLREICRVLAVGGIGEIQVPVGFGGVRGVGAALLPNAVVRMYMERRYGVFYTTTYPVRPRKLARILEAAGARIVEFQPEPVTSSARIRSYVFVKGS